MIGIGGIAPEASGFEALLYSRYPPSRVGSVSSKSSLGRSSPGKSSPDRWSRVMIHFPLRAVTFDCVTLRRNANTCGRTYVACRNLRSGARLRPNLFNFRQSLENSLFQRIRLWLNRLSQESKVSSHRNPKGRSSRSLGSRVRRMDRCYHQWDRR